MTRVSVIYFILYVVHMSIQLKLKLKRSSYDLTIMVVACVIDTSDMLQLQ